MMSKRANYEAIPLRTGLLSDEDEHFSLKQRSRITGTGWLTAAPTGDRAGQRPGCVRFRSWGLQGGSGAWSRGMDEAGGWADARSPHDRATHRIREASGWQACDRGWCSLRRWLSR